MHYRGRVHWLPHPERGRESHLVGGCDGRFIEAMAQAEHVPALRAQLAEQYRQSRATAVDMMASTLGPQLEVAGISPATMGSLVLALVDGLMMQYLVDPDAAPGATTQTPAKQGP